MELYHIHLLGNHDRLYKPNSEFVIDREKYNNRIYNRIYNMTPNVDTNRYARIVGILNTLLRGNGYQGFDDKVNLGEIIEYVLYDSSNNIELGNILADAKRIALNEGINLREMAMEEYRKNNCSELPSRLHSLFACSEEGINFWINHIRDNSVDIYRIEAEEEPFKSNELLLPSDELTYGEKVAASYNYFHPKEKDFDGFRDEYLVQGKVKILEKVAEITQK